MRLPVRSLLLPALLATVLSGCGGSDGQEEGGGDGAKAICTATALSGAPRLPAKFPEVERATYTKQSTQGPTEVVEGYYEGSVEEAHGAFKEAFEGAPGYTVLFDEAEEHDAEVIWKGEGRSGQVGIRDECGSDDRLYVRISNRPA